MRYDTSTPIAVFLGPSLSQAEARAILPANYYPPVRMGDVYRLLTCGVRAIVIVDGVFHATTPVWQREILAALANGIVVVGASSMGALRALELEPFGMIGHGTVFDWYRTGRIEGDDEVALLHADEEFGYRALSEPMVNIRYALARAVDAGVIAAEQEASLGSAMKKLDHARRSYPALTECAAFAALPGDTQAALRPHLDPRTANVKRDDARAVLMWCAEQQDRLFNTRPRTTFPIRQIVRVDEVLLRGVLTPGAELVTLRDLLVAAAAEHQAWVTKIVRAAARRLFVLEWMRHQEVRVPDAVVAGFTTDWLLRHGVDDVAAWLAANGLTRPEFDREVADRAAEAWLEQQGPAAFGLSTPFPEAWADVCGVEPPSDAKADFSERLIDFGPAFFGFDQWSPDLAFARELQITGYIARLASSVGGAQQLEIEEVADADAGAV